MSFDDLQDSRADAQPVGLVFFAYGGWSVRAAASQVAHTFDGNTYQPWKIVLPKIVDTDEPRGNDLVITVPRNFPVCDLWMNGPPSGKVLCVFYDADVGAPETRQAWTGWVVNVAWRNAAECEITVSNGIHSLEATGLREVAQRNCTHAIYSWLCGVAIDAFSTAAVVTDKGGNWIEADAFATQGNGYFDGGILHWIDSEGRPDWRFIKAHVGNRLTLAWGTGLLPIGGACTGHPGCDGTPNHCRPKFANSRRYGGLPHFVNKSPFDAAPVY